MGVTTRQFSAAWRGVFLGVVLLTAASGPAVDYPPADHGGAGLTLGDGDRIWGVHTAIRRLLITTGSTVVVSPYDGIATGPRGLAELHARDIDIAGVLTARGSGFTGGGGGGGGGAWMEYRGHICYEFPGRGGRAAYGNLFDGHAGGYVPPGGSLYFWTPGDGATGDGPCGGTTISEVGRPGGYMAPESNGDGSNDDSTTMGSGGGGGRGWWGEGSTNANPSPGEGYVTCGLGAGGGAGGRGGGTLRLFAADTFILRAGAILDASGEFGGDAPTSGTATYGNGGDVNPPGNGWNGALFPNGGPGAGGGVLLQLSGAANAVLEAGSAVVTQGGDPAAANGGTVKIRFNPAGTHENQALVTAGRIMVNPPSASVGDWQPYD